MPQTITLSDGEQVEIVTPDDLEAFGEQLGNRISAKLLRWLVTVGLLAVFGAGVKYADMQSRVTAVEQAAAAASTDKRADAVEIRQLVKKVDSLTVVLGNVNDVLGDIKARLR